MWNNQNSNKRTKGKFIDISLGTLTASLLELMLADKIVIRVAGHVGTTGEDKIR